MHYDLTTLPNGLRVITETMPEVRSAALGCWVDTGSRDETEPEAGASHFLEHLLFKGSEQWSAQAIAEVFDAVGAQSNAFTSKETTCFWARMRDADLPLGFELMGEMLRWPSFRQHEIDSERNVVLEEINMNEDDPMDVAHDQFGQALFSGHALELPILGTRESIAGMTRDTIHGYWARRYNAGSVVIAVAGHVDHDDVVAQVTERFGTWEPGSVDHTEDLPVFEPRVKVRRRDTEQAHLVIGGEGLKRDDKRRFAGNILNHIVGSGMSSRLFREIRELRGLAYAVFGFNLPYRNTGAWGVYVGTTPSQAHQVIELVKSELGKVKEDGITAEELERAKGHAKGSLAISMEDASSRMTRLGRAEINGMEHLGLDELVERFEAVTAEDVLDMAREIYHEPLMIGAVGPFDAEDFEEFVG